MRGTNVSSLKALPMSWVLELDNSREASVHISFLTLSFSGPSLLCDGVCERWRSHVPHPEVQEVWGAPSLFLHGRDHLRPHIPAQQRHRLQVWETAFAESLKKIPYTKRLRCLLTHHHIISIWVCDYIFKTENPSGVKKMWTFISDSRAKYALWTF